MNWRLLYVAPLFLAGCSTQVVATDAAGSVPQERIESTALLSQAPGTGTLIVKRDSGWTASGGSIHFAVDGIKTADFHTSEKLTLFLPTGHHVISAWMLESFTGKVEAAIDVASGTTYVYRLGVSGNGYVIVQPTAY